MSSKRKRAEVSDSKEAYIETIDQLSKEISNLENELEERDRKSAQNFSLDCLRRVGKQLKGETTSNRNSRRISSEEQELNTLISRINKLETLTGLTFDDVKIAPISAEDINNNNTKGWRRTLSGQCLNLAFRIEFETEEVDQEEMITPEQDEKDQSEIIAKITKLTIKLEDPFVAQEFSTFVSTAEQDKDLESTFIAFYEYAKWHDYRQRTLKHFMAKYPDLVHINHDPDKTDFMEVQNPLTSGLHFNIHWSVNVTRFSSVMPQIDAFVCCPEGTGQDVIMDTPVMFRKMLSSYGIEQAIEFIILIVQ